MITFPVSLKANMWSKPQETVDIVLGKLGNNEGCTISESSVGLSNEDSNHFPQKYNSPENVQAITNVRSNLWPPTANSETIQFHQNYHLLSNKLGQE